jgi:pimeloyl-ACP methyl ester carboxylesterase
MPASVDFQVDVTDAAGTGKEAHTAVTVFLPDPGSMSDPPVVCFGFPGGGYSRSYFSFDMPGDSGGGQAGYHTSRGWVFAAVDHLGVGESTIVEPDTLDYETVALANKATVETVVTRLTEGTLADGFPPVARAVKIGIGQSMGGCFTIVLQAQHAPFDAIASLGYSGIHTLVPSRPGTPPIPWPWMRRGSDLASALPLNSRALSAGGPEISEVVGDASADAEHPMQWAFHFDDEPADIVAADMAGAAGVMDNLPEWRSATVPACAIFMVTPGTVASEAASITVPVLLAMGERDVVPNPWMEPFAFRSSRDVTLYVCPRMAHMHNFAGTRRDFWARIHAWGCGVAATSG